MSARFRSVLLLLVILAVVAITSWCTRRNEPAPYTRLQGFVFSTVYHVTYESPDNWQDTITALFAEVDHSLSMFNDTSIISRFNRNDTTCTANAHFRRVFETGQRISRLTDGAFDMTVAPIVNLWGFGFINRPDAPAQSIDSVMRYVGWQTVSLDSAGHLHKLHPETILDASSIAKGYAVDVIARFLDSQGIANYMVEIGGEVFVKGHNETGNPWAVGIAKPLEDAALQNELQTIVHIRNGGLATSGNYRNYYYKDGKRYAHTIDPHTGCPTQQDILSATVLAQDCMTADALATSFMVLGSEKAMTVLKADTTLRAFFILAGTGDEFSTLSYPDDWVK